MDSIRALRLRCVACCTAIVALSARRRATRAGSGRRSTPGHGARPAQASERGGRSRARPAQRPDARQRKEATLQARQEGALQPAGEARRIRATPSRHRGRCRQRLRRHRRRSPQARGPPATPRRRPRSPAAVSPPLKKSKRKEDAPRLRLRAGLRVFASSRGGAKLRRPSSRSPPCLKPCRTRRRDTTPSRRT
jgi:hypothetical protein